MATFDFSKSTLPIDMTTGNPAEYNGSVPGSTATAGEYTTPKTATSPLGDRVRIEGNNLTFDGRPTGGTMSSVSIDFGDNSPAAPDIVVTGLAVPAVDLVGPRGLWGLLGGDDVISPRRLFRSGAPRTSTSPAMARSLTVPRPAATTLSSQATVS